MIKGLEHIAIAVRDIEAGVKMVQDVMGLEFLGYEEIQEQGVKVAFFKLGDAHLELLQAIRDDSPVAKFIAEKGEGIHHIGLEVNDARAAQQGLKKKGIHTTSRDLLPGSRDTLVQFIHPREFSGVLVELVEKKKSN